MNNVKHQWFSFYTDVFVRFCSEGYCSTWRMVACNRLEMLRTSQSSQSVTVNGYRNALLLCKLLLCKYRSQNWVWNSTQICSEKTEFSLEVYRHLLLWCCATSQAQTSVRIHPENLQCRRLLRNIDLSFDLQIFLNLLVTGLLEIAHV